MAVAVLLAALVLLRFQAWHAVLCLRPQSMKVEVETPADVTVVPGELETAWEQLQKLGFTLLGTHSETSFGAPTTLFVDGVHSSQTVMVSLCVGPDEDDEVFFLTQSAKGFVITANYRRPAREVPGAYLAGGLEGASTERVLKAHLRRLAEIGAPKVLRNLEDGVHAARDWYATWGKTEIRQRHAVGLLWTLGALGMVGAAVFRLVA